MAELETTGGETTGAPETAAVDQPVVEETTQGSAAAAEETGELYTPERLDWLKKIDWNKIPAEIRAPIEKPFLSEFNRKTENQRKEFSDAQTRTLQALTDRLTKEPEKPSQLSELEERARAGDPDALVEWNKLQMAPVQAQQRLQSEYASAVRDVPELANPEFNNYVGQQIQADPVAAELFARDGHRYAGPVLRAVSAIAKVGMLTNALAEEKARSGAAIQAGIKKGIEEHRAKVQGLPAKTTLAGSTSSGTQAKGAPSSMRGAISAAEWAEMGGRPEDFDL
jgi:hypothetical protein